jgi:pyruvate/2-oxoglutarate/acetoin dehydrogenase E1 component
MFGDFTTLASDPIINHAAKYHFMSGGQAKAPIVVRTTFGAGTGAARSIHSLWKACF